jgi:hypothetical protein
MASWVICSAPYQNSLKPSTNRRKTNTIHRVEALQSSMMATSMMCSSCCSPSVFVSFPPIPFAAPRPSSWTPLTCARPYQPRTGRTVQPPDRHLAVVSSSRRFRYKFALRKVSVWLSGHVASVVANWPEHGPRNVNQAFEAVVNPLSTIRSANEHRHAVSFDRQVNCVTRFSSGHTSQICWTAAA